MAEPQLDCPPLPKRAKRPCHFISKWVNEFQGVLKVLYTSSIIAVIHLQHYPIGVTRMQDAHIEYQVLVLLMVDEML